MLRTPSAICFANGLVCMVAHRGCSPETYESVRAGVFKAFPTRKAAMEHFDQYLGFKLAESCPNGLRNAVRGTSHVTSVGARF